MEVSLSDFVRIKKPKNAWVTHPEFSKLYVRMTRRKEDHFEGWWLDIAQVEAEQPGNGAFGRLLEFCEEQGLNVYVENVLKDRFARHLENLGLVKVPGLCPSFYRKARQRV